eukprot:GHVU01211555.1.p1 GENE.GHVU01211555.1~~GHVU01211555.1.p1  ORF type:complete len:125 (+),score=3.74 GHVU01211555.1:451-825(+)
MPVCMKWNPSPVHQLGTERQTIKVPHTHAATIHAYTYTTSFTHSRRYYYVGQSPHLIAPAHTFPYYIRPPYSFFGCRRSHCLPACSHNGGATHTTQSEHIVGSIDRGLRTHSPTHSPAQCRRAA